MNCGASMIDVTSTLVGVSTKLFLKVVILRFPVSVHALFMYYVRVFFFWSKTSRVFAVSPLNTLISTGQQWLLHVSPRAYKGTKAILIRI